MEEESFGGNMDWCVLSGRIEKLEGKKWVSGERREIFGFPWEFLGLGGEKGAMRPWICFS